MTSNLPTLRLGDGSKRQHPEYRQAVMQLQTLLNAAFVALKLAGKPLDVDGEFGQKTQRAIVEYTAARNAFQNSPLDRQMIYLEASPAVWDSLMEYLPSDTSKLIIDSAASYIGQREKPGNMGFKDPEFDRIMRAIGFHNGWPWCSLFAKLVWWDAYALQPEKQARLDTLILPSGASTIEACKRAGLRVDQTPTIGSIGVIDMGGWSSHVFIVIGITATHLITIEGNTNDAGGREGYIVARRTRKLPGHGTKYRGFIHPF